MCGIAGIIELNNGSVNLQTLEAMTRVLAHRGPDGEGYVLVAPGGHGKPLPAVGRLSDSLPVVPKGYQVGFGHRRLSILDLSPLGHQPMSSQDGRCWLVYNGEIYNYVELRDELRKRGHRFRSQTDTEVLLAAYQEWGTSCLGRLNGMFAFALWDGARRRLFCARDRFGMKPFYYRATPDRFLFGSEIKALLADPRLGRSPNPPMIHDFLVLGLQDHSEDTFFTGIRQLRPAHYLLLEDGHIEIRPWWDLAGRDMAEPAHEEGMVDIFRGLFGKAIAVHLRSDVPVGSCLSGGLDSSSVVCAMSRLMKGEEIQTFTAGFDDPRYDERRYARAVEAFVHAKGTEVLPDGRRLFEDLPRVLWYQDEPFAGTSYLAQWSVMKAAAERGVKVLLDGQGGDELLCGYPGYWGSYLGDLICRGALGRAFTEARSYLSTPSPCPHLVLSNLARALLPTALVKRARWRMKRHGTWIDPSFARLYADRTALTLYERRFRTNLDNHVAAYLQTHSLPALLHHEDRNAMAFSVEARLPFLDTPLVEFLFQVPPGLKLRNGLGKYLLREAMAGVLPEEIRNRRDKLGFATPQEHWLRRTLRDELEGLFQSKPFEERGYWDPVKVRALYRRYCESDPDLEDFGSTVWRWICLEMWHRRFFQ